MYSSVVKSPTTGIELEECIQGIFRVKTIPGKTFGYLIGDICQNTNNLILINQEPEISIAANDFEEIATITFTTSSTKKKVTFWKPVFNFKFPPQSPVPLNLLTSVSGYATNYINLGICVTQKTMNLNQNLPTPKPEHKKYCLINKLYLTPFTPSVTTTPFYSKVFSTVPVNQTINISKNQKYIRLDNNTSNQLPFLTYTLSTGLGVNVMPSFILNEYKFSDISKVCSSPTEKFKIYNSKKETSINPIDKRTFCESSLSSCSAKQFMEDQDCYNLSVSGIYPSYNTIADKIKNDWCKIHPESPECDCVLASTRPEYIDKTTGPHGVAYNNASTIKCWYTPCKIETSRNKVLVPSAIENSVCSGWRDPTILTNVVTGSGNQLNLNQTVTKEETQNITNQTVVPDTAPLSSSSPNNNINNISDEMKYITLDNIRYNKYNFYSNKGTTQAIFYINNCLDSLQEISKKITTISNLELLNQYKNLSAIINSDLNKVVPKMGDNIKLMDIDNFNKTKGRINLLNISNGILFAQKEKELTPVTPPVPIEGHPANLEEQPKNLTESTENIEKDKKVTGNEDDKSNSTDDSEFPIWKILLIIGFVLFFLVFMYFVLIKKSKVKTSAVLKTKNFNMILKPPVPIKDVNPNNPIIPGSVANN